MRELEAQLRQWAKPPGERERDRCENAEAAIRNAIKASNALRDRNISVFPQGSYRNNTNVRKDSDVDIAIRCKDTFFYDPLPEGWTREMLKISDATYHYAQFKNDVEEALIAHFGRSAVKRSDKAFDIHETSYHVEADVAPFFDHRRYLSDGSFIKPEGVELRTDNDGRRVINWPEQHYANGVEKNKATGMRYKALVRILKALSNEMAEKSIGDAAIPGFLVECLVWNVPNDHFQNPTYTDDLAASLAFLHQKTSNFESCSDWGEVNELKYLFGSGQKWNYGQANAFIGIVRDYVGFGN